MAGDGEIIIDDGDGETELADPDGEIHLAGNDPQPCCCEPPANCYVKPKNCYTNVDHPLYVVPCPDAYAVFTIFGPGDCWYIDPAFTQYDAIPEDYTELPSPETIIESCDDCYSEPPGTPGDCSLCNRCPFAEGDLLIVTFSCESYVGEDVDPVNHAGCVRESGSMQFTWNDSVQRFEAPGIESGTLTWDFDGGIYYIDGTPYCSWQGSIDAPSIGSGSYSAAGTIYGGTGARVAESIGFPINQHLCSDLEPGDPGYPPVVKISLSAFPTANECDNDGCVSGAPDEYGCCP